MILLFILPPTSIFKNTSNRRKRFICSWARHQILYKMAYFGLSRFEQQQNVVSRRGRSTPRVRWAAQLWRGAFAGPRRCDFSWFYEVQLGYINPGTCHFIHDPTWHSEEGLGGSVLALSLNKLLDFPNCSSCTGSPQSHSTLGSQLLTLQLWSRFLLQNC